MVFTSQDAYNGCVGFRPCDDERLKSGPVRGPVRVVWDERLMSRSVGTENHQAAEREGHGQRRRRRNHSTYSVPAKPPTTTSRRGSPPTRGNGRGKPRGQMLNTEDIEFSQTWNRTRPNRTGLDRTGPPVVATRWRSEYDELLAEEADDQRKLARLAAKARALLNQYGPWACGVCTYVNTNPLGPSCEICATERTHTTPEFDADNTNFSPEFDASVTEDWPELPTSQTVGSALAAPAGGWEILAAAVDEGGEKAEGVEDDGA